MKNSSLGPSGEVIIVAPSWKCPPEELSGGVQFLKDNGFDVSFKRPLLKSTLRGGGFLAQTDSFREDSMHEALLAPARVVWCLRGGYGAMRILESLQKLKKPKSKFNKVFVGLSDITCLHLFLNQHWNWPTLHAPVLSRLGSGRSPKREYGELLRIISGRQKDIKFKLKPMNSSAKNVKNIEAKIFGGNLSLVQAGLGTFWEVQTQGRFLFLEDVSERGYRIDRMLQSLVHADKIRSAKGILFGDFTGGDEPNGKNYVWRVLNEFAISQGVPVFRGIQSGHGPLQRPLPLNAASHLRKTSAGHNLIVDTGWCSP